MQWTLAQLRKQFLQNPRFDDVVDVSEYIPEGDDVISVSKAHVKGDIDIEETYDGDIFHFDMQIKATLQVACSRSLKPVDLPLDFEVTESFSEFVDEETRLIEGLSIDLLPVIWSNIYLEKPMRVVHPDAEAMDDFEDSIEEEPEESVNPKLAKLEDYKS